MTGHLTILSSGFYGAGPLFACSAWPFVVGCSVEKSSLSSMCLKLCVLCAFASLMPVPLSFDPRPELCR